MHCNSSSPLQKLSALSYGGFFSLWTFAVLCFAVVYVFLSYVPGANGLTGFDNLSLWDRFWQALYFSVINATNTGYGDVVPLGVSRVFATVEAVLGLFLFALFTAKLLLVKQERLSEAIYRDMRETTIRNMREDLYIVRKDIKKLTKYLTGESGIINERGWERLNMAYRQLARFLRDIRTFYDGDMKLDSLDEAILLHSLYRTLGRVVAFNDVLVRNHIIIDNYTDSENNLQTIRNLLNDFMDAHANDIQSKNGYLSRGLAGIRSELDRVCANRNLQKNVKDLE